MAQWEAFICCFSHFHQERFPLKNLKLECVSFDISSWSQTDAFQQRASLEFYSFPLIHSQLQRPMEFRQNKSIEIPMWKFSTIGIHLFEPFCRVQIRNTPNPGNWYSDSNIFLQEPPGACWYFWQEALALPSLCRMRNLQLRKKRKWLLLIAWTSPPATWRRQVKRIYRIRRCGIDNCGC